MAARPGWWIGALLCASVLPGRNAKAQVVTLFENDSVRVSRATIRAGTTTPLHTHTLPHVTYVESGGTLRIRHPDGRVDTVVVATGSVYWGKVETHVAENPGPTDVVLITVDLKPSPSRKPPN